MRELNLRDIQNPEAFQELCEELLSLEYDDFKAMNDTMGDKGCDGLAHNDELFFQFYYPEQTGTYREKMHKIQRKIAKDLAKLKEPYPRKWILVTVDKASADVHSYCRKRESDFGNLRILVWSEPNIKGLLEKHSAVKNKWIQKIYGESTQVIQPEAITYSERDNLPELLKIDQRLGRSLGDWKFGDKLKQVHKYDSTGKAVISVEPIDPQRAVPISVSVVFKFDNSERGQKKLQEFFDTQRRGTEFKAGEEFIDKIEFKVEGHEKEELSGLGAPSEFAISSHQGPPVSAFIEFHKRGLGRLRRIPSLEVRMVRAGTEEALINNAHQENERIKFAFTMRPANETTEFNMTFDSSGADAIDGLRYAETLADVHRATSIKLFVKNAAQPFEMTKKSYLPEEIRLSLELSKMLAEIQDTIGESIPSISGSDLSSEDLVNIRNVHRIVTTGKLDLGKVNVSTTLMDPPRNRVENLLNERGLDFKLESKPITATIFGKEIELGRKICYFTGVADVETRTMLKEALAKENLKEIKIRVESISEKLPAVEFYPKWMIDPEAKLRDFELKRLKKERALALK